MNTIVKKCFLICAYVLVLSCSQHINNDVSKINSSTKENAKPLTLKEVPTGEALDFAEECYLYNDILVVLNYSNSNKHFLEFYDINTMELKKQAIMRGNGPEELIEIVCVNYDNHILVNGFMEKKLAKIYVEDFVKDKNAKIDYIDYKSGTQRQYLFDDNRVLVVNPYRFIDNKLNINQDDPRFIIMDATDRLLPNGRINAINVNIGGILVNHTDKKICYYSNATAEIEIYDFDLNLIKTITGPDKIIPEYSTNNGVSINFASYIPLTYTYAHSDDSYMYLVYEGRSIYHEDIIRSGGKIENLETWIFKLDWDGNVVDTYKVSKEKKILSLSVTKNGALYLCCKEEGLIKLFKAEL